MRPPVQPPPADVVALLGEVLGHAAAALTRADFVRGALSALQTFSGADVVGLWVRERYRFLRFQVEAGAPGLRTLPSIRADVPPDRPAPEGDESDAVIRLGFTVAHARPTPSAPLGSAAANGGSVWCADLAGQAPVGADLGQAVARGWRGLALIPVPLGASGPGLLKLKYRHPHAFDGAAVTLLEAVGDAIGVALSLHETRLALRERMKEMSCLYEMSQVVTRPDLTRDDALAAIAALLPRAWQYPEIAAARIEFEGLRVETPGFTDVVLVQSAPIERRGRRRGRVIVGYREPFPTRDEEPFLPEERTLLEGVAREIGLIVERLEAREQQARLQEQLIHAERLATIGQLAAGVAHELNEPLSSVLGFTQLAARHPDLPAEVAADLGRVVEAALHARGVIRNLLAFARPAEPVIAPVDLNVLAQEALRLVQPRGRRGGIRLHLDLAPDLPPVRADGAQIRQVLVNLAVNAVQAMPQGGDLTLRTEATDDGIRVEVTDTGEGFDDEVRRRLFEPIFTTKRGGEGTGLGLSLSQRIVEGHGGRIEASSRPGEGACFRVTLPRADAGADREGHDA